MSKILVADESAWKAWLDDPNEPRRKRMIVAEKWCPERYPCVVTHEQVDTGLDRQLTLDFVYQSDFQEPKE